MPLKTIQVSLLLGLLWSCSVQDENQHTPLVNQINLEQINLDSPLFAKLNSKTSMGETYVDFSYNYMQTSLFKRHINTIGLCIDPDNSEYIRRYSYSYKKAGEHEKAIKMLNLSIDSETVISEKLYNLDYAAWSYLYYYRDYKNTIASVDKIMGLNGNDHSFSCHGESCLLLKGQALYRLGQFEKAIAVFETFQNNEKQQGFDPMDNFYIVFYKAICQVELQRYDDAKLNFTHLISKYPSAEVSFQLAKLYYHLSDFEKAKIHLNNAQKALSNGYTFKEPYFERFDKVFEHDIQNLSKKLNL